MPRRATYPRCPAFRVAAGLALSACLVAAATGTVGCALSQTVRESAEGVAGAPSVTSARVVRVIDGDTAVLALDGQTERVRFIGIDTPESTTRHEPYGEEASAYTRSVLNPGRSVFLEMDVEPRDRYGRLLAYVWLTRPTDRSDAQLRQHQLNAQLLLDGYAQQMTIQPNSTYADRYTAYAREARERNRGLWALPPSR